MEEENLQKSLSYPVLLVIIVNLIMGTGIFMLPPVGAKVAGAASLVSWIILSLFAIYIAACMGELTSMFPREGGVYEFCKQAYGRFLSFIVGWVTIISGTITIAMLSVGAVRGIISYLSIQTGQNLSNPLFIIGLPVLFVSLFHLVAYRGIQTSAKMLIFFGSFTLLTLLIVIIPGIFNISFNNFEGFLPLNKTPFHIYLAIFFIAETFFGWEQATFLAGETENGKKVVPKALVVATILIAIISFSLSFVEMGNIPMASFIISETPVPALAQEVYGSSGWHILSVMASLAIMGCVGGWITSAPRLLLAMAKDKLLFSQLGSIHPKNKSPHKAILFQAIIVILLVAFTSVFESAFEFLLHLLIPLVIFQYIMVILALIVLRAKRPYLDRPFKVPFPRAGPWITIAFLLSIVIIWLIKTENSLSHMNIVLSFILVGIPLYFLIELYYDPRMINKINEKFAFLFLITEKFNLPKRIQNEILELVGNINGQTVFEYGCNVGTLTVKLSERTGPEGKVFATDLSKNGLHITKRRLEKAIQKAERRIHSRVHLLHDEFHTNRIHPEVHDVNLIVSVGMISYVQDIKKVLREMYDLLPEGGRICIVEYVEYMKIVPDVEWLATDESIQDHFMECGFTVKVIRKKGLFWNYVFIYGVKYSDQQIMLL